MSNNLKLENITFLDPVPKIELARLLRSVDVGMMILANVPGFYNGTSPNKFFDYIASGLPVLVNYPGWMKSIIEKEQCGIAVPPEDSVAFADAVITLKDNTKERITMGKNSRILAEREFDRNILAARFIKVLEEVYNSRKK